MEALSLSTTTPRVGENVRARFKVRNVGGQALTVQELTAAARRGSDWNGEWTDFPHVQNITLQPNGEYTYEQWRTFSSPGAHFAEPTVKINGSWGGIEGANRVSFTVQSPSCSGSPIGLNQTVQGTISSSGQQHTYCLAVNSAQWISMRMVGNPGYSGNNGDPVLEVYDPAGRRIGFNDNGAFVPDPSNAFYRNSFLSVYLPSAGTYKIIARMNGSNTGPYAMRVESGREAAPGDVDRNCKVNSVDYSIIVSRMNTTDQDADISLDGIINSLDAILTGANVGRTCSAGAP